MVGIFSDVIIGSQVQALVRDNSMNSSTARSGFSAVAVARRRGVPTRVHREWGADRSVATTDWTIRKIDDLFGGTNLPRSVFWGVLKLLCNNSLSCPWTGITTHSAL